MRPNGSPRSDIDAAIRAAQRRKRAPLLTGPEAIVLVAILIVVAILGGLVLTHAGNPFAPKRGAAFAPQVITVSGNDSQSCVGTSCSSSQKLITAAYSYIVLAVTTASTTAPSAVASHGLTFALLGSESESSLPNPGSGTKTGVIEVWAYGAANVSASAGGGRVLYVNYTGSTSYGFKAADFANVTTAAKDAVGSGSKSTNSTTATDSCSASVAGDFAVGSYGVWAPAWGYPADTQIAASSGSVPLGNSSLIEDGSSSATVAMAYKSYPASTGSISIPVTLQGHSASGGHAIITQQAPWVAISVCLLAALAPAAPTGLAAGAITTTTIALAWTDGMGPVVNETVYQASYTSGCGAYTTHYSTGGKLKAYTVTALAQGSAHCFYVETWNTTAESAASNVLTDVLTLHVPAAPSGAAAVASVGTTASATITWTNPPGPVVNDTLFFYTGPACGVFVSNASVGNESFASVNNLSANTSYSWAVQAWNATGGSVLSACAAAQTNVLPQGPGGLGSTGQTSSTVSLSWVQPPWVAVLNYTIFYGSACSFTHNVSAGTNTYGTVPGIAPLSTTCFAVAAWDAGGRGPLGHPYLNVTTAFGAPAVPTNLTLTSRTLNSLSIAWTKGLTGPATPANGTVYWGATCSFGHAASVGLAAVYTIVSLASAATECVGVSTWDSGGQSPIEYGNFTTLNAAPAAPTGVHEVTAARHNFTIAWTNPGSPPLVNDTLRWTLNSGCSSGWTYISTVAPETAWTITGLTPFTDYYVEVFAWSNGGESPASACALGVTQNPVPPAPVINATSTTVGTTWVVLAWTNPAGYTLFNTTVFYGLACGGVVPANWGHTVNTGLVTTYYNVSSLIPNTTYCFSVQVWDGGSNLSLPWNFTTLGFGNSSTGNVTGALGLTQGTWALIFFAGIFGSLGLFWLMFGADRRRDPDERSIPQGRYPYPVRRGPP